MFSTASNLGSTFSEFASASASIQLNILSQKTAPLIIDRAFIHHSISHQTFFDQFSGKSKVIFFDFAENFFSRIFIFFNIFAFVVHLNHIRLSFKFCVWIVLVNLKWTCWFFFSVSKFYLHHFSLIELFSNSMLKLSIFISIPFMCFISEFLWIFRNFFLTDNFPSEFGLERSYPKISAIDQIIDSKLKIC